MGVLKKAKKKVKKEKQDKINLFQVKNFLDLNNAKELPKICAVMALSGVCKHFEVEFKITGITNENLLKGNAKIQKLTEKNTLWCTFELEEIIKRSFGTLTRIIEEFHYEELHTRITEKFKNYFVMDFFGKLYFEEKEKIKLKYKHQLKTKYNDTKRALKGIIEILACYGLFKKFISEKMDEISKKNRMYIKTLITKTDKGRGKRKLWKGHAGASEIRGSRIWCKMDWLQQKTGIEIKKKQKKCLMEMKLCLKN